MKVPLLCNVYDRSLVMVVNGKYVIDGLPMRPHVLEVSDDHTKLVRRLIGSHERVSLLKKEFDTVGQFNDYYSLTKHHKIDYIEQVYCYLPDYFYRYPSSDPSIMSLDIEVLTDGSGVFPRAQENPIVAIGVKMYGQPVVTFAARDASPDCDAELLWDLLYFIDEHDPDIIATYNGVRFDLDYMIARMLVHKINPELLGRQMTEMVEGPCMQLRDKVDPTVVSAANIPGRIHWDMFRDVDADQSLLGVPNKRLKTVAKYFGWSNVIDLGRDALSNTSVLVGTDELVEYLASDVQLTERLVDTYLYNHIAMAELLGIPLREEILKYSSLPSKILHIRNLSDRFVALDTNADRYKSMLGTMRYESARVAIYKDGNELPPNGKLQEYYEHTSKVDFSSQYPSAMMTFNLSPDTTRIVDVRPYTGEFDAVRKRGKSRGTSFDYLYLNIPDSNANKQVIIRVDLSYDSFLRRVLNELKAKRKAIRALMADDPDNKMLHSQQLSVKVAMNTIYGYEGLASSTWGDLAVAIAVVGICRYLIGRVEEYLGDKKIETDSISGDTPVCLLIDDKYIDYLPVSELIPHELRGCCDTRYNNVPDNIKVLTSSGWSRIRYVKQHMVNGPLYRLTSSSCCVDVTGDHSVFTDKGCLPASSIEPVGFDCLVKPGMPTPTYFARKHPEPRSGLRGMTVQQAEMFGLVCAYGTYDSDNKRIVIRSMPRVCADRLNQLLLSEYSRLYRLASTRIGYDITIDTPAVVSDIVSKCITETGEWRVPFTVLNGSNSIKAAFINGVFHDHSRALKLSSMTLCAGLHHLVGQVRRGRIVIKHSSGIMHVRYTHNMKHVGRDSADTTSRITGNTRMAYRKRYVYDICTEEPDGSFVGGTGDVLLHNTDGIAIKGTVDIDDLNRYVSDVIMRKFGVESNMGIELEEVGEAFFYKMKNYITRSADGSITRKGAVFKSSRHSRIYDKVLSEVITGYMNRLPDDKMWELIKSLKDMSRYGLTDFIMSVSIKQEVDEYANPAQMQPVLAREVMDKLGMKISAGDQIDYIVTKKGRYTPAALVKSISEVDTEYYAREVEKILEVFGIHDMHQPTLW